MSEASDRPESAHDDSAPSAWSQLSTEQRLESSRDLDTLPVDQACRLLLAEDAAALRRTSDDSRILSTIGLCSQWFAETLRNKGRVVFVGAGTSGRLGVLEAAECPPTFGTDPEQIEAVIAGGRDAVFEAVEGAEDDADAGARAVSHIGAGDLCIGISASSVTPFPRAALQSSREAGARTVLLTCAPKSPDLEQLADLLIALDTGPEVLSGSTRLKAGSATKAALNAITTSAMIRLGKIYENLMVDLRSGSAKLRARAVRIVATAAACSPDTAQRQLARADGDVKVAVVMQQLATDPEAARQRLDAADGHLRNALLGNHTEECQPAKI